MISRGGARIAADRRAGAIPTGLEEKPSCGIELRDSSGMSRRSVCQRFCRFWQPQQHSRITDRAHGRRPIARSIKQVAPAKLARARPERARSSVTHSRRTLARANLSAGNQMHGNKEAC
jgi:hypothetical protein